MKKCYFAKAFVLSLLFWCGSAAQAQLRVVTTLSSYSDLAKQIGENRVEASYLASPRFNPHFIEPRPSDVLKVKRADLLLHSGLDLEAWRGPLLDAVAKADFRGGGSRQLDLSAGITLLEVPSGQVSRAEGDIHQFGNPHYWIDPRNGLIMARAIASKLSEVDPAGRSQYEANLAAFEARLQQKMSDWRGMVQPFAGNEVFGYHREWPYLMEFMGLRMEHFVEPKPGIPPGPRHLEQLVEHARSHAVKLLLQASYSPDDAGKFLAEKAGVATAVVCQNVGELPQCSDYIAMVDFAVSEIVKRLR